MFLRTLHINPLNIAEHHKLKSASLPIQLRTITGVPGAFYYAIRTKGFTPKSLCGYYLHPGDAWCSATNFHKLNSPDLYKCGNCVRSRKIPMLLLKELNNE